MSLRIRHQCGVENQFIEMTQPKFFSIVSYVLIIVCFTISIVSSQFNMFPSNTMVFHMKFCRLYS